MYEKYRYINCYIPTKACKLTGKQIQLYSYLAYQSQFPTPKTKKGLAAYLCVSQGGVADMLSVLAEHGLYDAELGVALDGQPTWLNPITTTEHWSNGYMYWRCLVRCPASTLSFGETTVLSYLWHWTDTKKKPKWSVRYIAGGTGLSERIVQESLAALKQKWLVDLSGSELTLYTIPVTEQAVYFVSKDEPSPSVVTVKERPADALQPQLQPDKLHTSTETTYAETIEAFIKFSHGELSYFGEDWKTLQAAIRRKHPLGYPRSEWERIREGFRVHLDKVSRGTLSENAVAPV